MRYKKTAAALSLVGLSALLAACDAITAQQIPSSTTTAFNNGAGLGGRGAQMGMPGGFADGGGLGGMIDGVVDEAFDADVIGRIAEVDGNTVKLELLKQGTSSAGDGAHSPGGAADGQTDWTSTGESLTLTLSSEVRISSGSSAFSGEGGRGSGGRRGSARGDSGAAMPGGGISGNGSGDAGGSASGGSMPGGGASSGGAANGGASDDRASGDSVPDKGAFGSPAPGGSASGGSTPESAPSADAAPSDSAVGSVSDLKAGQIVMVWYKEGSKTVDRIRILRTAGE